MDIKPVGGAVRVLFDGVVVADDPEAAWEQLAELLPAHRVWDRFPAALA